MPRKKNLWPTQPLTRLNCVCVGLHACFSFCYSNKFEFCMWASGSCQGNHSSAIPTHPCVPGAVGGARAQTRSVQPGTEELVPGKAWEDALLQWEHLILGVSVTDRGVTTYLKQWSLGQKIWADKLCIHLNLGVWNLWSSAHVAIIVFNFVSFFPFFAIKYTYFKLSILTTLSVQVTCMKCIHSRVQLVVSTYPQNLFIILNRTVFIKHQFPQSPPPHSLWQLLIYFLSL